MPVVLILTFGYYSKIWMSDMNLRILQANLAYGTHSHVKSTSIMKVKHLSFIFSVLIVISYTNHTFVF